MKHDEHDEDWTIPVIGPENARPEPEPDIPLQVDRNCPHQQALAKSISWARIEQIARS